MHVNYRYCLERARLNGGPVLDFGCGAGDTVKAGLATGLDIYGADVFQLGDLTHEAAASALLGDRVLRIVDGRLPFEDCTFQTVICNQVFEHVDDLDGVLAEIARVLKPGGKLLALFPTREVWFEGHCRIPFAHRLVRLPVLFKPYMTLAHWLGFGIHREGKTRGEWVDGFADYLTRFTAYRSIGEIQRLFLKHGFAIKHDEADFVRFRWGRPIMPTFLFRRLAGIVLDAKAI